MAWSMGGCSDRVPMCTGLPNVVCARRARSACDSRIAAHRYPGCPSTVEMARTISAIAEPSASPRDGPGNALVNSARTMRARVAQNSPTCPVRRPMTMPGRGRRGKAAVTSWSSMTAVGMTAPDSRRGEAGRDEQGWRPAAIRLAADPGERCRCRTPVRRRWSAW